MLEHGILNLLKNDTLTPSPGLIKNVEMQEIFKKSEVKVWECRNCGHIVVGTQAPDVCPVCAHPQSFFEINEANY